MRWHGESRGAALVAALVAAGALDGAPEPAGQRRAAEDELFDPHEVVSYLLEPVWESRGESGSL